MFYSAFSACSAANDFLFTEKLNVSRQNFNSPTKSCFRDNDVFRAGPKTKDSLLTRAASMSQAAIWLSCLAPTFADGAAIPLKCQRSQLCFWPDFCTYRIFIRVRTNHFLKRKL